MHSTETVLEVLKLSLDDIDAMFFIFDELAEAVKGRLSELPDECPEKAGKECPCLSTSSARFRLSSKPGLGRPGGLAPPWPSGSPRFRCNARTDSPRALWFKGTDACQCPCFLSCVIYDRDYEY